MAKALSSHSPAAVYYIIHEIIQLSIYLWIKGNAKSICEATQTISKVSQTEKNTS